MLAMNTVEMPVVFVVRMAVMLYRLMAAAFSMPVFVTLMRTTGCPFSMFARVRVFHHTPPPFFLSLSKMSTPFFTASLTLAKRFSTLPLT